MTSPPTASPQPLPVAAPAPAQSPVTAAAAAVLEQRRDTDSPGTIRPFPSLTEFIEDSSAKLGTPERIPTPPKAPIADFLNPQDINLHRPPSTSPLESEAEEELENTRLVSIEEFLRQDQEPAYCMKQQVRHRPLILCLNPIEPSGAVISQHFPRLRPKTATVAQAQARTETVQVHVGLGMIFWDAVEALVNPDSLTLSTIL